MRKVVLLAVIVVAIAAVFISCQSVPQQNVEGIRIFDMNIVRDYNEINSAKSENRVEILSMSPLYISMTYGRSVLAEARVRDGEDLMRRRSQELGGNAVMFIERSTHFSSMTTSIWAGGLTSRYTTYFHFVPVYIKQ